MNDTHGVEGKGWYGFDLDGTLAKYDGWKGIEHIGEPVKPMVDLMKRMHNEGKVVKIVTARVAPRRLEDGTFGEQFTWLTRGPSSDPDAKYTATMYIQDWCEESAQLGFLPEIVYQRDRFMIKLYDDRAWWHRWLHMLRGDYWRDNMGSLPCARHEARFHKTKEDNK